MLFLQQQEFVVAALSALVLVQARAQVQVLVLPGSGAGVRGGRVDFAAAVAGSVPALMRRPVAAWVLSAVATVTRRMLIAAVSVGIQQPLQVRGESLQSRRGDGA